MLRFLVAEDDIFISEILEDRIIQTFQAEVVLVNSGNRAIKLLKEDSRFDFVISDYNMPDGNGREILEFLTKNEIKIPFAYFTSVIDQDTDYLDEILVGTFAKSEFEKLFEAIIYNLSEARQSLSRRKY